MPTEFDDAASLKASHAIKRHGVWGYFYFISAHIAATESGLFLIAALDGFRHGYQVLIATLGMVPLYALLTLLALLVALMNWLLKYQRWAYLLSGFLTLSAFQAPFVFSRAGYPAMAADDSPWFWPAVVWGMVVSMIILAVGWNRATRRDAELVGRTAPDVSAPPREQPQQGAGDRIEDTGFPTTRE